MIDPEHGLSIQKQAEVLEISRSTVYYRPRPVSALDLWWMRQIDELHLNYPFAGSRMLREMLSRQGLEVGRRHVCQGRSKSEPVRRSKREPLVA